MITGLIKADRGRIDLDGHDITRLPMYQRARAGISYLPQEASVFRKLTVEENILAVLETLEITPAEREERLTRLLERRQSQRLAHPVAGDHVPRHIGRPLKVVLRSRRDVTEYELLSNAATQQHVEPIQ